MYKACIFQVIQVKLKLLYIFSLNCCTYTYGYGLKSGTNYYRLYLSSLVRVMIGKVAAQSVAVAQVVLCP